MRVVLDDLGLAAWPLVLAPRRWEYVGMTLSIIPPTEEPPRIIIRAGLHPYEALYTLLHEAAHVITGDGGHERGFRRGFAMLAGFYGYSPDFICSAEGWILESVA